MTDRLLAAGARLVRANPERVLLLRDWFERAAAGQAHLNLERVQGPSFPVELKGLYLFAGAALFLFSFGVAAATAFVGSAWGAAGIAFAAAFVELQLVFGLARRCWLDSDDLAAIGWWPVSLREVAIARVGLLLDLLWKALLLITTLPLLVYVVTGDPPLIAAVLLVVGLSLQSAGLLVSALLLVHVLVRAGGRRLVGRWFHVLLVLLVASWWIGTYFAVGASPTFRSALGLPEGSVASEPTALFYALPLAWAPAWASLFTSPYAWIGVLAGLAAFGCVIAALARFVLPGGHAPSLRPLWRGRLRVPIVRIVEAILAPFAPGREGWVVRRLTGAHLREDPWMLGFLAPIPLCVIGMLLLATKPEILASLGSARASAMIPLRSGALLVIPAVLLPLFTIPGLVYSSHAQAAWCVAVGELSARRLMQAQRGVARALSFVPMIVTVGAMHSRAGTPLAILVPDLVLIWLVWEANCRAVQKLYPILPFSRPRQGGGSELIPYAVLAKPTSILLAAWVALLYDLLPWGSGKILTIGALVLLVVALDRSIDRRVGAGGLPIEIATSGR